jgi:hypothetical protein
LPKRYSNHLDSKIYREEIVAVGEKANARNCHSPNMVPPERDFVNLSKSQPTTSVWMNDVSEVVREVMEGSIAARCASCPEGHSEV